MAEGSVKSPLLDEAEAAEAPYPCGRCGAFHGNESGFCAKCSVGWLNSAVAAKTGRLQRRSYLCLLYTSPSPRDKRQSRMPSSA